MVRDFKFILFFFCRFLFLGYDYVVKFSFGVRGSFVFGMWLVFVVGF